MRGVQGTGGGGGVPGLAWGSLEILFPGFFVGESCGCLGILYDFMRCSSVCFLFLRFFFAWAWMFRDVFSRVVFSPHVRIFHDFPQLS